MRGRVPRLAQMRVSVPCWQRGLHPETRFRPAAAGKLLRDCGARQLSEVFLKASCASRSLCGCTGRTDMLLKFSFFQQLADAGAHADDI